MAGANAFGIDLGQIIGTRNALMNSQQQQQMNALQIQQGQRTQDYQNALSAAPDDPARLGVMQKFDPEKALQYGSQLVGAQRATHDYQVKQTLDALGALTDPKLPDESLPDAVNAVKANLSSQGVPTASLDQAVQQSGGDPAKLRTALSFALSQGMDYQSRLNEQDKAATRKIETDKNAAQAAQAAASLAQSAALASPAHAAAVASARTTAEINTKKAAIGPDDPAVLAYKDQVYAGGIDARNVPVEYRTQLVQAMDAEAKQAEAEQKDPRLPPIASQRLSQVANTISQGYRETSGYKLAIDGLPYIERIKAAMSQPHSSNSDAELLDAFTKLNNSGNAVTDTQVNLVTGYKSYADMLSTLKNKIVGQGGALSNEQRMQIEKLADATYDNYQKGYAPMYQELTDKLRERKIPESLWPIPNFNKLATQTRAALGAPAQGAGQSGAPVDFRTYFGATPQGGPPQVPGAR